MFRREREREREAKEQNGGPPVGQVRVLVVGDSGNLILFQRSFVLIGFVHSLPFSCVSSFFFSDAFKWVDL